MKIEIAEKKKNPFLKREEIRVNIIHEKEATPRKAVLQQLLSKELGKEPEYIEVKNIFSEKGRQASKSKVFVWEEKKAKDLSKEAKKSKSEEKDKGKEEKKDKKEEHKSENEEKSQVKETEKSNTSTTGSGGE